MPGTLKSSTSPEERCLQHMPDYCLLYFSDTDLLQPVISVYFLFLSFVNINMMPSKLRNITVIHVVWLKAFQILVFQYIVMTDGMSDGISLVHSRQKLLSEQNRDICSGFADWSSTFSVSTMTIKEWFGSLSDRIFFS